MNAEPQEHQGALVPLSPLCPVCSAAHLAETLRTATLSYAGNEVDYLKRYMECPACGATEMSPEDAKFSAHQIVEAKRKALGAPSRDQLRKMRAHFALTQDAAGKIFGVGPTAFSKYETGDMVPAAPTARLLLVACENPDIVPRLAEHYGVKLPKRSIQIGNRQSTFPLVGSSAGEVFVFVHAVQPSTGTQATRYLGNFLPTARPEIEGP